MGRTLTGVGSTGQWQRYRRESHFCPESKPIENLVYIENGKQNTKRHISQEHMWHAQVVSNKLFTRSHHHHTLCWGEKHVSGQKRWTCSHIGVKMKFALKSEHVFSMHTDRPLYPTHANTATASKGQNVLNAHMHIAKQEKILGEKDFSAWLKISRVHWVVQLYRLEKNKASVCFTWINAISVDFK